MRIVIRDLQQAGTPHELFNSSLFLFRKPYRLETPERFESSRNVENTLVVCRGGEKYFSNIQVVIVLVLAFVQLSLTSGVVVVINPSGALNKHTFFDSMTNEIVNLQQNITKAAVQTSKHGDAVPLVHPDHQRCVRSIHVEFRIDHFLGDRRFSNRWLAAGKRLFH